jgi:hypothetical protein
MNWYRVEIVKNKKIINAWMTLADRRQDIIENIESNYPKYTKDGGYSYNIILRYDGH